MIVWQNTDDEWAWLKELSKDMDSKGQTTIVTNCMLTNSPLVYIIGKNEVKDFYKKELEISYRMDPSYFSLLSFGFFYKNDLKHIHMRGAFSQILKKII